MQVFRCLNTRPTPQEGSGNPDRIYCPKFPSTPAVWRGRAFPIREGTSRGQGKRRGKGWPPGAAQRPSPLVPLPLTPGEKCSQNNPHSLEALCARILSGAAEAWLRTAPAVASGAGATLTEQRQGTAAASVHALGSAVPAASSGVPPRAGTDSGDS